MSEKWQFVHDVRGGWWLRLTSDEDIVRYIKATNDRYDGAMCKAVHSPIESMSLEERIKAQILPEECRDAEYFAYRDEQVWNGF